jgi:hypothetical protein
MVLYGYDASVFNSVQGSDNWVEWMNNPSPDGVGMYLITFSKPDTDPNQAALTLPTPSALSSVDGSLLAPSQIISAVVSACA